MELNPLDIIRLNGDLNYADSNIKGTDEELRNRPRWWGGFSALFFPRNDFILSLERNFCRKSIRFLNPTGDVELDPYALFNASATWKPRQESGALFSRG